MTLLDKCWLKQAQKLELVAKELGRLPMSREKMGGWLFIQRQAVKDENHIAWTLEHKKYMDDHFPGWLN